MPELKVQPLQNQPTLNPVVRSAQSRLPLAVTQARPQQSLSVAKPVQPQITSIGTAVEQQPYDQLKTSISNLDSTNKQNLSAILARGQERGLTQDQMRQVASAYIDQNPQIPTPQPEEKSGNLFTDIVEGIASPFVRAGVTTYNRLYAEPKAILQGKSAQEISAEVDKARNIGSLGEVKPYLSDNPETQGGYVS